MEILKVILLVIFFIISTAIIVLSFIINKDSDDGTVEMGTKNYYGNGNMSVEDKLDLSMKILFILFVLDIIGLYFVL